MCQSRNLHAHTHRNTDLAIHYTIVSIPIVRCCRRKGLLHRASCIRLNLRPAAFWPSCPAKSSSPCAHTPASFFAWWNTGGCHISFLPPAHMCVGQCKRVRFESHPFSIMSQQVSIELFRNQIGEVLSKMSPCDNLDPLKITHWMRRKHTICRRSKGLTDNAPHPFAPCRAIPPLPRWDILRPTNAKEDVLLRLSVLHRSVADQLKNCTTFPHPQLIEALSYVLCLSMCACTARLTTHVRMSPQGCMSTSLQTHIQVQTNAYLRDPARIV